MKILAIEKEASDITAEQFRPCLKPEAARVWELYQAGIIRELYFGRDQHNAVLILECDSVAEAAQALGTFPLVEQGLITFELIPLMPYSGFARLFVE